MHWFDDHGWKILLIVALAVTIYFVLRGLAPPVIRRAVSAQMRGHEEYEIKQRVDTLSRVLVDTVAAVVAIVSLFTILDEVGINITAALAGFGVAGIAIGFGAQSLVKDLIAGAFILLENQYVVGDWIKVAGVDGMVEQVNLRRTVLRDMDGTVHSIPNGEITVASNYTKEWSRVNLNVRVGYEEDLDHATEVINRTGKEMAEEQEWRPFIFTPPHVLRIDAFEDSGIAIKIWGDVKAVKQADITGELRRRIKRAFDQEGIEIPWPHTKVYFGSPLEQQEAKEIGKPSKQAKAAEERGVEIRDSDEILPPPSRLED